MNLTNHADIPKGSATFRTAGFNNPLRHLSHFSIEIDWRNAIFVKHLSLHRKGIVTVTYFSFARARILASIFFAIAFSFPFISSAADPRLPFQENFDHGNLATTLRYFKQLGNETQLIKDPRGGGGYVLEHVLRRFEDRVSYRTETRLYGNAEYGADYWWTITYFIPADWETDAKPELLAQWFAPPDTALGESWIRNPPVALNIKNDKWNISGRWDDKPLTVIKKYSGSWSKELGPVEKGKWTKWVFRTVFSYQNDGTGLLTIWKDGEQVYNRAGPNTYNDEQGPYLKFGLYKPVWKSEPSDSTADSRRLYVDDFEIGVGLCTNTPRRSWCPGFTQGLSTPFTPTIDRDNISG